MNKKRAIIGILAIILLGVLAIGYAIGTQELTIGGTATAEATNAEFDVKFVNVQETATKVTGTTAGATLVGSIDTTDTTSRTAKITAAGFTKAGDEMSLTYTVKNNSVSDLNAKITAEVTENTNSNYILATVSPTAEQIVTSGNETTYTVTVKCVKTPATEKVSNITITLSAVAAET